MDYNKAKATSTTGVRYLNINYRKKHGNVYIVRVNICSKNFPVWRGDDYWKGKAIAEKVQELMSISNGEFIDWYDNDRERWLKENGY